MEKYFSNEISAKLTKIILIFFCFAAFNSLLQIFVIQKNNEIENLKTKISFMERELSKVKVEIAALESFERIQTVAQTELGMRVATPKDYQCIAMAPPVSTIDLFEVDTSTVGLWAKVSTWWNSVGRTMAKGL